MNAIQEAKRLLYRGLIFKCSQIGFALRSTLCYTNRVNVGIHDYAEYGNTPHSCVTEIRFSYRREKPMFQSIGCRDSTGA